MRCPKCYFPNTRVYDTRVVQNDRTVRRRRECEKCSYRFTTLEEVKVLDLKVEKRNGQIVDFSQEKLEQEELKEELKELQEELREVEELEGDLLFLI
jgi:transcriptional repressor NrdR